MSRPLRAIAEGLARLSTRLASHERRDWIRAMTRELDEIEGDAAALHWTAGCFATAFKTRITAMKVLHLAPRALVGLLILHSSAQQALKPMMLGRRFSDTAEIDRFNPWIEATPVWQVGLEWVCVGLYLASAVQLFRRRVSAAILFAAAFVLDVSDMAMMHAEPTFQAVFPEQEMAAVLWLTLYMAALGLAAAWMTMNRRDAATLNAP
jgi:hypothetical protein